MNLRTQVEAYFEIKNNGLLSYRRFQVYQIIFQCGPINCRKIITIACSGKVTNTGAISGRLSELIEREVIEIVYEASCPVTGHNTSFYSITNNLPRTVKKLKTKTKNQIIKGLESRILFLENKNNELFREAFG